MPELPEVETTCRGIAPHVSGRLVTRLAVHEPRLRWRVNPRLAAWAEGQRILGVRRRAKYLLLELERGHLLMHLGMSGSLRVLPVRTALETHDHFDLEMDSGWLLRFNDPRRFGSLMYLTGDPARHPLLRDLAPEPLEDAFDADYLYTVTRRRSVAIKLAIMNSRLVVGVGNIYASEALFRAGIRPGRAAKSLTRAEAASLVDAIRTVLEDAIRAGGTTLRDYVGAGGEPGYFRQKLFVYERAGEPCRRCGTCIRQRVQGQRSTYFCPHCQQ
ncbi:MAG TPA: bifunctional DNA-formamidopyrimidine glycosylase/DNA-(apurinic or apyrimidinic site) lyase [Steroidobacteraceae bacterium]|nr:bifunctional DNA-formamidopyrimidine glycosylase/DNA-(apurinic or apyrimidinic site) lyase [Steroidobacteraceae bacterium]